MKTHDVNYEYEPSYEVKDALRLVLLFHAIDWTAERRAEWLRITGTKEATTKVLCDYVRSCLEILESIP